MKYFILKLLILLPLFVLQNIFGQLPNWQWVNHLENAAYSYAAADVYGHVYMTGRFNSASLTIGGSILSNSSSGTDDIYLVKYDAAGNVIWARSAGGNNTDYPMSIAVDLTGNIYITGLFESSTISFTGNTMTNSGIADPFLAKYDASGNVLWIRQGIGSGIDVSRAVTTDVFGNVYIAGHFFSSAITFGSITLNNSQSADAFVVKYDASGNALWAKNSSGDWEEEAFNVAVDISGNVFITGYFSSTSATFGSITLTKAGLYTDMFIVKYDASGSLVWAKNSTGSYYDVEAHGLITDASGNVFVSGHFAGTIIFETISLTSVGGRDIYISKLAPAGNTLWATQIGGSGDEGHEGGNPLSIDPAQNIYITGKFSSTMTLGTATLTSTGLHDCFVAKINVSGNVVWAKQAGGTAEDETYSIKPTTGGVYLSGYVNSNPAAFDAIQIPKSTFLAKLSNCAIVNAGNDAMVFFGNSSAIQGLNCTILTANVTIGAVSGSSFNWTSVPVSTISNSSSNQITVCPTVNTTYTVTYTTPSGCIATDDVLVKAIDVSCGNNNNKVKICITTPSGQQSTVCVASSAVASVLANNPNAILGDCSAYSARVTDMVSEEAKSTEFRIYPNPSNNYFTLAMGSEITDQKISLRILDLQGRLIEKRSNLTANQTLQIGNNYRPGVYIAEILQGNKRRIVKLVKM